MLLKYLPYSQMKSQRIILIMPLIISVTLISVDLLILTLPMEQIAPAITLDLFTLTLKMKLNAPDMTCLIKK